MSEFSSRSGLIPLAVTCGTNFTVVVHSASRDVASSDPQTLSSGQPAQTIQSDHPNDSGTSVWFKKPQTVEGFLDEQLQASALADFAIATAQLDMSDSLKSKMFLGRSIESHQFIPFPEVCYRIVSVSISKSENSFQATVAGILKEQIAQSSYFTKDEKRAAFFKLNNLQDLGAKADPMRAILVSFMSSPLSLPHKKNCNAF